MKHREKQLTRYQNTMETTMELKRQQSSLLYFIPWCIWTNKKTLFIHCDGTVKDSDLFNNISIMKHQKFEYVVTLYCTVYRQLGYTVNYTFKY